MKLFCLQIEGIWANVNHRASAEKTSLTHH